MGVRIASRVAVGCKARGRPSCETGSARSASHHEDADEITLKLQTDTQPGDTLVQTWPAGGKPRVTKLAAKRIVRLEWNLARLFPGQFGKPGTYWLQLDGPAGGDGRSLTIEVEPASGATKP